MDMQSPLKEAALAFLRIVVLSAVPLLIDALSKDAVNWKAIGIALAIAFLKSIDEFIHTYGKNTGSSSLLRGLTRF